MSLIAQKVDVFQKAGSVTDSLTVRMDQMSLKLVVSIENLTHSLSFSLYFSLFPLSPF